MTKKILNLSILYPVFGLIHTLILHLAIHSDYVPVLIQYSDNIINSHYFSVYIFVVLLLILIINYHREKVIEFIGIRVYLLTYFSIYIVSILPMLGIFISFFKAIYLLGFNKESVSLFHNATLVRKKALNEEVITEQSTKQGAGEGAGAGIEEVTAENSGPEEPRNYYSSYEDKFFNVNFSESEFKFDPNVSPIPEIFDNNITVGKFFSNLFVVTTSQSGFYFILIGAMSLFVVAGLTFHIYTLTSKLNDLYKNYKENTEKLAALEAKTLQNVAKPTVPNYNDRVEEIKTIIEQRFHLRTKLDFFNKRISDLSVIIDRKRDMEAALGVIDPSLDIDTKLFNQLIERRTPFRAKDLELRKQLIEKYKISPDLLDHYLLAKDLEELSYNVQETNLKQSYVNDDNFSRTQQLFERVTHIEQVLTEHTELGQFIAKHQPESVPEMNPNADYGEAKQYFNQEIIDKLFGKNSDDEEEISGTELLQRANKFSDEQEAKLLPKVLKKTPHFDLGTYLNRYMRPEGASLIATDEELAQIAEQYKMYDESVVDPDESVVDTTEAALRPIQKFPSMKQKNLGGKEAYNRKMEEEELADLHANYAQSLLDLYNEVEDGSDARANDAQSSLESSYQEEEVSDARAIYSQSLLDYPYDSKEVSDARANYAQSLLEFPAEKDTSTGYPDELSELISEYLVKKIKNDDSVSAQVLTQEALDIQLANEVIDANMDQHSQSVSETTPSFYDEPQHSQSVSETTPSFYDEPQHSQSVSETTPSFYDEPQHSQSVSETTPSFYDEPQHSQSVSETTPSFETALEKIFPPREKKTTTDFPKKPRKTLTDYREIVSKMKADQKALKKQHLSDLTAKREELFFNTNPATKTTDLPQGRRTLTAEAAQALFPQAQPLPPPPPDPATVPASFRYDPNAPSMLQFVMELLKNN